MIEPSMRDMSLLVMLLVLVWMAWRWPWMGMLGLAFLSCTHPQSYAVGYMQSFPVYLALFIVVALAALRDIVQRRSMPELFWDWRLAILALLWAQFLLTTILGLNPWAGWPKFRETAKILPPLLLALVLIDTREKLYYLNLTMAISIAAVVLKGGYWAVITGFHDRVYGPPGSQFGDNNEFAVATAMMIPLLMLWYRENRQSGVRWALVGLIALSFAAALSSWSRGGLLSLGVVSLLLVWHSRRKWIALPFLLVGLALIFVSLPEQWFDRMGSLGAAEVDASARSRLDVWRLGWTHAMQHPWFGAGFEGWVYLTLPTGGSLDWHSAYVEMVVEHGLPGLALWGMLVFGSLISLTRLIWRNRQWRLPWLTGHAAMLRAALSAYGVGAVFLGIAYWELLFLLIISAILLERFARLARMRELPESATGGNRGN